METASYFSGNIISVEIRKGTYMNHRNERGNPVFLIDHEENRGTLKQRKLIEQRHKDTKRKKEKELNIEGKPGKI